MEVYLLKLNYSARGTNAPSNNHVIECSRHSTIGELRVNLAILLGLPATDATHVRLWKSTGYLLIGDSRTLSEANIKSLDKIEVEFKRDCGPWPLSTARAAAAAAAANATTATAPATTARASTASVSAAPAARSPAAASAATKSAVTNGPGDGKAANGRAAAADRQGDTGTAPSAQQQASVKKAQSAHHAAAAADDQQLRQDLLQHIEDVAVRLVSGSADCRMTSGNFFSELYKALPAKGTELVKSLHKPSAIFRQLPGGKLKFLPNQNNGVVEYLPTEKKPSKGRDKKAAATRQPASATAGSAVIDESIVRQVVAEGTKFLKKEPDQVLPKASFFSKLYAANPRLKPILQALPHSSDIFGSTSAHFVFTPDRNGGGTVQLTSSQAPPATAASKMDPAPQKPAPPLPTVLAIVQRLTELVRAGQDVRLQNIGAFCPPRTLEVVNLHASLKDFLAAHSAGKLELSAEGRIQLAAPPVPVAAPRPKPSEKAVVDWLINCLRSNGGRVKVKDLFTILYGQIPRSQEVIADYGGDSSRFLKNRTDFTLRADGLKVQLTAFGRWRVDVDGQWTYPGNQINAQVEAAHIDAAKPRVQAMITSDKYPAGQRYTFDVTAMVQVNDRTGYQRKLKRSPLQAPTGATAAGSSGSILPSRAPNSDSGHVKRWKLPDYAERVQHPSDPEALHYNQAVAHFAIMTNNKLGVPTTVEFVHNTTLQAQFDQCRQQMGSRAKEVWVFHGTASANVDSILSNGFRVGGVDVPVANGTAYGRGVYTSTAADTAHQYGAGRQVLLARALTAREGTRDDGICDMWRPRPVWAVFREGRQLLPVYVLRF